MTQKRPMNRIASWYVSWATTLDSAGRDSRHVQERLQSWTVMALLYSVISGVVIFGEAMDNLKRYLFYGQDDALKGLDPKRLEKLDATQPFEEKQDMYKRVRDHRIIMLLHSAMGLVTEAAEMMQTVGDYIFKGKTLDWLNIHEELGDTLWYVGIGTKAEGVGSIESVMAGNYGKLTSRYGDTWGHEQAITVNRDKVRERSLVQESMMAPIRPTLYYLASPRAHKNPEIVQQRVVQAQEYTYYALLMGQHVFSPIAHSWQISDAGCMNTWNDWEPFDIDMLSRCDSLLVLRLPGWDESVGVRAEIEYATSVGMSIHYVDPVTPDEIFDAARDYAIRKAGGSLLAQEVDAAKEATKNQ